MENTLEQNDRLIISNTFYTPERGDIVVFYSSDMNKALIKRVIGIPGDVVEIKHSEDGKYDVFVNGELIEEGYAFYDDQSTYSKDETGIWFIEDNKIFVMGDNRFNSLDSRSFGPVDADSIMGKVLIRFYPFDKFGEID